MSPARLLLAATIGASLISSAAGARDAGGDVLSFSLASSLPEREVIDRAFRSYANRFVTVGKIATRQSSRGPLLASLELYGRIEPFRDPWTCRVEVLHATFEPVRGPRDGEVQVQGFTVQPRYHVDGPVTDYRTPPMSDEVRAKRATACAKLDPTLFFADDGSGAPSFELYNLSHPDKLLASPVGLDLSSLDPSRVRDIHRSLPSRDVLSTWIVFADGDRDLILREDRRLRSDQPATVSFALRPRDEWMAPPPEDFATLLDKLPTPCAKPLRLDEARSGRDAATIKTVFGQIACAAQHASRPQEPHGMVYNGHLLDRLSFATQPRRTAIAGLCSYELSTMFFGSTDWLLSQPGRLHPTRYKGFIDTPAPSYRLRSMRLYRREPGDCAGVPADDRFFMADSAIVADRALVALDRAAAAIVKADRLDWMPAAQLSFVSITACPTGEPICVHAAFDVSGTRAAKPDQMLVDIPIRAADDPTPIGDVSVEESWGPIA